MLISPKWITHFLHQHHQHHHHHHHHLLFLFLFLLLHPFALLLILLLHECSSDEQMNKKGTLKPQFFYSLLHNIIAIGTLWPSKNLSWFFLFFLFSFLVKPVFLRVKGPSSPVVEGEMISFSCTVDGALPPATIVWFNRSEMISPHPISSTELMNDGTFR